MREYRGFTEYHAPMTPGKRPYAPPLESANDRRG